MRTALILLVFLAIASIPGSILPQQGIDPVRVNEWIANNPTSGPILKRFGFFDVYASPWFAAIYLLLFISLIGCILPRSFMHARALRAKPPVAPRNLTRLSSSTEVSSELGSDAVIDRAERVFRAKRWRVRRGQDEGGPWIAAEKGYWRETGNLVFHIALIVLLIGVGYGSLWGWKGNVIVVSGKGFSDTLTQYDVWGGGRMVSPSDLPPFSFTLNEFTAEFERGEAQRGAPRFFEGKLTVRDTPGAVPYDTTIGVNEPLSVDGVKVFLVGHGYAPHIIVRDTTGAVVFDDTVPFLPQDGSFTSTGVVKVPDATPQIGIQGLFLPTAALDEILGPYSTFPAPDDPGLFMSAWVGDLGLNTGATQSVYRLDTAQMTLTGREALRPGETWTLPDGMGSVEFVDFTRWASFQIAHDPGQGIALIAVTFAIVGLLLSLFVKRRRMWVRARPAETGSTVVAAGLARGDDERLESLVNDVATAAASDSAQNGRRK
jgi:cytochrome c biogenesis protein